MRNNIHLKVDEARGALLASLKPFSQKDILEKQITVLVIDDELRNVESFKANLRKDFIVFSAINFNQCLEVLNNHDIDIVICDLKMPDKSGIEVLSFIKQKYPHIKRMATTAFLDSVKTIELINQCKVSKVFSKPWDFEEIAMDIKQECYK